MSEEDDSDATTCCSDWVEETSSVHMVPDTYDGDTSTACTSAGCSVYEIIPDSSTNSPNMSKCNPSLDQQSTTFNNSSALNFDPSLSSASTNPSFNSLHTIKSTGNNPCTSISTLNKHPSSLSGVAGLKSDIIENNPYGLTPTKQLHSLTGVRGSLRDSSPRPCEMICSSMSDEKESDSSDLDSFSHVTTDHVCSQLPKSEPKNDFNIGFDDHYFHRPRFSHPTSKKRSLLLSPPGTSPSIEVPATLNQYLRGYQQEGVRFLYGQFCSNSSAVLCDDMGLGKTIQVIAFMVAILGKKGTKEDVLLTGPKQVDCKGTFLIVCPSSVLYNWKSEIETWSHLKQCVYHSDKKEETFDKARRKKTEVVLTTHETARTHIEKLNSIDWLAVVCDEVQAIKSSQAQVTVAMNSLKAKRRIGLTGTALQNNLSELWSILNWANPDCLGSPRDFRNEFEHPILEGQKYNCTKRQLALGRQRLLELEELMQRWVLRRTKSLISSQLPKKEEVVVFCPISDLQGEIYQEILETEDAQLVLHAEDPCDCLSGKKRGSCCYKGNQEGVTWQKLGYAYTTLLSKCANHLGLLLPDNTTSMGQKDKVAKVCGEVFSKHPEFSKLSRQASFLTLSDIQYCGKMQVVQRLLSKFQIDKSKVIVFSNSVILLNIIENHIVSQSYTYSRLDGHTKIEDRARLVNTFNSDPSQFVFLISKKCGGVGLNITGANRVIIFDPSWNPATDLQAEDRAFRIGQSRDVKVYRLITEGTVEELVYLRQVYKQQLANMALEGSKERRYFQGVAGDRTQKGELFGYNNLWPLRKPGQPGLNLTLDLLKRADCVEAGVKATVDVLNSSNKEASSSARQVRDSESSIMPVGTTTIAHSGGKSVVESSSVEEHIGREALADVYALQQHSQEPANCVSNKLDVSDESDDVDTQIYYKEDVQEPSTLVHPPESQYLYSSLPSTSDSTVSVTSKKGKKSKCKDVKNSQKTKEAASSSSNNRGRTRKPKASQGRVMRRKKVLKGLEYEEESPPSLKKECHNVVKSESSDEEEVIRSILTHNKSAHAETPKKKNASSNSKHTINASNFPNSPEPSESRVSFARDPSIQIIKKDGASEFMSQEASLSWANHQMVDELFGGSDLHDDPTADSRINYTHDTTRSMDETSKSSCDSHVSMNRTTPDVLCTPSLGMLPIKTYRESQVVCEKREESKSTVSEQSPSSTKPFNIDELFGF